MATLLWVGSFSVAFRGAPPVGYLPSAWSSPGPWGEEEARPAALANALLRSLAQNSESAPTSSAHA